MVVNVSLLTTPPHPSLLTIPPPFFIPPGKQVALPCSTCLREEEEGRTLDWRTWTRTQRGRKETRYHCHASAFSPGTERHDACQSCATIHTHMHMYTHPHAHTSTCTHIHMYTHPHVHTSTGSISIYGHHVAPMPTSSYPLPPVWTGTGDTVAPHCVTLTLSSRVHITGSGASRQTRR